MLRVTPLPAFQDNYIWAIHAPLKNSLGQAQIIVVDPGDAKVVKRYLSQKNRSLAAILVTHHHHDHVGGLLELKQDYQVPVYGPLNEAIDGLDCVLVEADEFEVEGSGLSFKVIDVPGHTLGHIAYLNILDGQTSLFCGDTLFSAGCGRMFEGTPEQFSRSLDKLANLPSATAVYCTHEYTASNLRFAHYLLPDNTDIAQYQAYVAEQRTKNKPTLPSTMELEARINPFLNCHKSLIQSRVAELSGIPDEKLKNDPVQTFAHMRQLKDKF